MVKKILVAFVLCVATVFPLAAADSLVRFDGGIGVIPVSNVAGPVNADGTFPNVVRNIVRGVNPPGQIWVIRRLRADVDTEGHITVDGRGLLLGGGNAIGMNANQRVFATLICEAAAPVERNTDAAGVALEPNGDFRIDGMLNPAPTDCPSPVLLIRTTGGTRPWFAAGILKLDDN